MFILYLVSGLCLFMGIGIKYFKWDFLISGYNTMNKKDKEKVDVEGLCRLTGNFMILTSLLILISGIAQKSGYKIISLILLLTILPLTVIQIILSQKYDHNKDYGYKKFQTRFSICIILFITIFIGSLFLYGIRDPKTNVTNDKIIITGIYGSTIRREDIKEIKLVDEIPKIVSKTNGFDLGYILRGYFKLDDIGNSKIFIHENKSPYIIINTDEDSFIINFKDKHKTIKLYNQLNNLKEGD